MSLEEYDAAARSRLAPDADRPINMAVFALRLEAPVMDLHMPATALPISQLVAADAARRRPHARNSARSAKLEGVREIWRAGNGSDRPLRSERDRDTCRGRALESRRPPPTVDGGLTVRSGCNDEPRATHRRLPSGYNASACPSYSCGAHLPRLRP